MSIFKITSNDLKLIANDCEKKLISNHMSNVTIINSFDIFITFSMYRKEKLLISLNPQNPFVCLTEIENPCSTKIGNLNDVLRKELRNGYIVKCEALNNDRIFSITYGYLNDYYDREERKLIIELIPHRPNLIILDRVGKIMFVNHPVDLSNERPLLNGLEYRLPENENKQLENDFDLDSFKKFAADYYFEAKRKRLEEQFKPVLQHIKSRIKTLKQKIKVLEKEIETAKSHFVYQDIGNTILTYAYDEDSLKIYVQENQIDYDFSQTPGVNANKYFSKFKKAKRTIEIDEKELVKTNEEIEYLETCLAQSKYMSEEDIIELAEMLFPKKFQSSGKKKIEAKPGEVIVNGTKIMFGKNAKQNDQLTFKKANKEHWFFHIKDLHGSHVIVCSDKPEKEVILTACEIALLLSGKEVGEVQSTQVKKIKKGSYLGQAILTSYETYTINKIRKSTKDLLKK